MCLVRDLAFLDTPAVYLRQTGGLCRKGRKMLLVLKKVQVTKKTGCFKKETTDKKKKKIQSFLYYPYCCGTGVGIGGSRLVGITYKGFFLTHFVEDFNFTSRREAGMEFFGRYEQSPRKFLQD